MSGGEGGGGGVEKNLIKPTHWPLPFTVNVCFPFFFPQTGERAQLLFPGDLESLPVLPRSRRGAQYSTDELTADATIMPKPSLPGKIKAPLFFN